MGKLKTFIYNIYLAGIIILASFIVVSFVIHVYNASKGDSEPDKANMLVALEEGNLQVAKKLIDSSYSEESKDKKIKLILLIGARYGQTELFKSVYDKSKIDIQDTNDLLIEASQNGNYDIVKYLIANGADVNSHSSDRDEKTALMTAAIVGHEDIVRLLIQNNANTSETDKYGHSALYFAMQDLRSNILQILLDNNANINELYDNGDLLSATIEAGYPEFAEKLIKKNIYINKKVLLSAAERGYFNVVKLLLEKGADINQKDNIGNNLLMKTCESGNLSLIKFLLTKGFNINEKNEVGEAAIDIAAKYSDLKTFEYMVNQGASYENSNYLEEYTTRDTALCNSIEYQNIPVLKFLLSKGVNVNSSCGYWADSALVYAARKHRVKSFKVLLDNNADISLQNRKGETALSLAEEENYQDIIGLIRANKELK